MEHRCPECTGRNQWEWRGLPAEEPEERVCGFCGRTDDDLANEIENEDDTI